MIFHRYICTATTGMYVIIRKNDNSPFLHINHVKVDTKQEQTIEGICIDIL